MLWAVALAAIITAAVLWIERRYPLTPRPRWKFNAPLPKLLGTGAVACLGWVFVAGRQIGAHHRAHEEYHHRCVVRLGRWRHLGLFLWAFVVGLWRHKLGTYTTATGRRYLMAYWWHPEEIAARAYADAEYRNYVPLGGSR